MNTKLASRQAMHKNTHGSCPLSGIPFATAETAENHRNRHRLGYVCQSDREQWNACIDDIKDYDGYISLSFIGAGSKIRALVGQTEDYLWISFPYQNKASTLAHPNDVYWNLDELSQLFGSAKDGTTVAYGLRKLYEKRFILKGDDMYDD